MKEQITIKGKENSLEKMFLKWAFLLVSVSWSISTVSWLPTLTPLRSVTSLTELLLVEGPSLALSPPEDAVCSLTGGPPSPSSVWLFLDPVAPSWNINRGTCWRSYQLQITRVAVDWRVKLGLYWTSKTNTQTNTQPSVKTYTSCMVKGILEFHRRYEVYFLMI